MEMNSLSQPETVKITTEDAVAAFIEVFVDVLLPDRPSKTAPSDEQHQALSKQLHAVVILYNYYQRKRHPELEFLGFKSFCKLVVTLRPAMIPYMKGIDQSDSNVSDVPEDHLSLTEKAIMNACKTCLALDVPKDIPIKENWPISKVVVFLVDSSINNCVLMFCSETQGIWSLLEKSVDDSKVNIESVWRNKRRKSNNKDIVKDEDATEFTHKQLAFSAIKELKGTFKKAELVFLESHVVYSLSQEKTAVRFYIVKCTGTIENVKPSGTVESSNFQWADINEVLQSMEGPLVENIRGTWFAARPAEHLHLLPYAGILSNFISSKSSHQQVSHNEGHQTNEGENSESSQELSLGHGRTNSDKLQFSQEILLDTLNNCCSEMSPGCLDNVEIMISSSESDIHEVSDATIKYSRTEDENATDVAGPTCSVIRLHSKEIDETVAYSARKEDKVRNGRIAESGYRQYAKNSLRRRGKIVSTSNVKDKKVAADFKAKHALSELKDDKLGNITKSRNNISMKQDHMTIGDGALVPSQMNTNSLNKVQSQVAAEELSVAAFRVLITKRERLIHQLRNLQDDIAICDKNIQTILDCGKDGLALKIDPSIDCSTDVCIERKEVSNGTCHHARDQVSILQVKGKSMSEDLMFGQLSCQALGRICCDNQWTSPKYSVSSSSGGYVANVTIDGGDFEWLLNGSVHQTPDAAIYSAAENMILQLRNFACHRKSGSLSQNIWVDVFRMYSI